MYNAINQGGSEMMNINTLPLKVQQGIKDTLKAFDVAYITFSGGEYRVSTGTCLLGEYPADYRVVGDVSKDDVYTKNEQAANYVECFHDYPAEYKGKRDYKMLQFMKNRRKNGVESKVEFDGIDFVVDGYI
jgi:hypothetical protein